MLEGKTLKKHLYFTSFGRFRITRITQDNEHNYLYAVWVVSSELVQ